MIIWMQQFFPKDYFDTPDLDSMFCLTYKRWFFMVTRSKMKSLSFYILL